MQQRWDKPDTVWTTKRVPYSEDLDLRLPYQATRPELLSVPEAVEKAAEEAALTRQRRGRRRRDRALPSDGLIVIGPRDSVDDLLLIEVLGSFDLGHIADKHPVLHHLSLKACGAVGVPLRLTAIVQRHADPELIHAELRQMSVDAAVAQRIDHPAGPVLVHPPTLARNLPWRRRHPVPLSTPALPVRTCSGDCRAADVGPAVMSLLLVVSSLLNVVIAVNGGCGSRVEGLGGRR